jgi:hypothetical protein
MLLHFYQGYFFPKGIALSAVLFCLSANGMEAEVKVWQGVDKVFSDSTIKKMVRDLILSRLDLSSIGRFASVCKSFKNHSFADVYPHLPKDSVCLTEFQDYRRCTKMLRYISSTGNSDLFRFVWKFDEEKREQELKDLYGLSSSISSDMAMQVYHNDYERLKKTCMKNEKEKLKSEKRKNKEYHRQLRGALWKGYAVSPLLNGIDAFDLMSKNYIAEHRGVPEIMISEAVYTNVVFSVVCGQNDADIVWKLLGVYIMKNPVSGHHYLLKNGYRFIHQLAEKGLIDCNVADKYGKRALHYAVKWEDVNAIEQLRQCGALINVGNNLNRTPLHNACKLGFVNVIEALLKWDDINVHIQDNKGKEPQDLLSKKNFIVRELFKQHDRKNNSYL